MNNKTRNCDNREVFAELPDNSIDLILTDPPYKDYQSNRPIAHEKVKKINQSDFDLPYFIRQSGRVLKPGCHFYCWCDHLTFPYIYFEISKQQNAWKALSATEKRNTPRNYLRYKNCLVWVKNNHGSGDLKGDYAPQHEFIIFACKGEKGRPLETKRPSNVLLNREGGKVEFFRKVDNYKYNHGTSKPVEILEMLLRVSTKPGELVLDPYAGSMSTGEACIKTERDYLLIEIDPDFFVQGLKRLEEVRTFIEK